MPVMDGVAATRALVGAAGGSPGPRVLVLTTFDADEHVVEALRAGASGFLLKDVPPPDFVRAIRIVAAGEALIVPSVTRRLLDRFARLRIPADESHAERLVLAEPTVKTHVSHLLLKLDLRDRAQLVVLAYELGVARPGSAED